MYRAALCIAAAAMAAACSGAGKPTALTSPALTTPATAAATAAPCSQVSGGESSALSESRFHLRLDEGWFDLVLGCAVSAGVLTSRKLQLGCDKLAMPAPAGMKKTPSKKLSLERITIATLRGDDLQAVAGGLPKDGHTGSVCGTACCDTDQFTNCQSRPGICW